MFPEESSQGALYGGVAEGMVADLMGGRTTEGVIMAYGVTSAGKTYTMQVRRVQLGLYVFVRTRTCSSSSSSKLGNTSDGITQSRVQLYARVGGVVNPIHPSLSGHPREARDRMPAAATAASSSNQC